MTPPAPTAGGWAGDNGPVTTGRQRAGALLPTAPGTDLVVELVLLVLVLASTARYVIGHGLGDQAGLVLAGAVVLVVLYAARRLVPAARRPVWLVGVCLPWAALVVLAPSFGWCALALAFAALRVLPYQAALVVIAALVLTVSATWARMGERFDPTVVLGPVCLAVLAVGAYRALDRDAAARDALLTDLHRAQDELAATQRREGALAERHRLSREIHDSVAQDLSSINLLLQATEQHLTARPADVPVQVREQVRQAAATARAGLVEARRVVHDLSPVAAPADAAAQPAGVVDEPESVGEVLRQLGREVQSQHGLTVHLQVTGQPVPVPAQVATALVRTARGALANVVEHAHADIVVVTLSYLGAQISLDVCDDGQGLARDTSHARPAADLAAGAGADRIGRGHGLRGIRDRVQELGGQLVVESTPGTGTALAVTLPIELPLDRPSGLPEQAPAVGAA